MNQQDMKNFCRGLLRDDVVVLDTKTTGLDSDAEILQIAVIDVLGRTLMYELVRPVGVSAWKRAQAVHGISPEMVIDAPIFAEFVPRLANLLRGKTVVVYNAPYDKRLMEQSARLPSNVKFNDIFHCEWVDLINPYAEYWGDWSQWQSSYKWQKLTDACRQQGVAISDAHSALGDCLMTLGLLKKLGE